MDIFLKQNLTALNPSLVYSGAYMTFQSIIKIDANVYFQLIESDKNVELGANPLYLLSYGNSKIIFIFMRRICHEQTFTKMVVGYNNNCRDSQHWSVGRAYGIWVEFFCVLLSSCIGWCMVFWFRRSNDLGCAQCHGMVRSRSYVRPYTRLALLCSLEYNGSFNFIPFDRMDCIKNARCYWSRTR